MKIHLAFGPRSYVDPKTKQTKTSAAHSSTTDVPGVSLEKGKLTKEGMRRVVDAVAIQSSFNMPKAITVGGAQALGDPETLNVRAAVTGVQQRTSKTGKVTDVFCGTISNTVRNSKTGALETKESEYCVPYKHKPKKAASARAASGPSASDNSRPYGSRDKRGKKRR